MAFDQSTRNRLQKFVSNARAILGEEFTRQLQATYGLDPKQGTVAAIDSLTHLDNRQRQTAHLLRETLAHYLATTPGKGEKDRTKQVLDRIVREQAFTVLNRLAALRMAEARGFLLESIAKAHSSKGFQLYRQLSGTAHGETGDAYRNYLFSLFDEFSLDLAVLFDRHSAQGRLFPRESALLELLAEINHHEIEHLWSEDETIGWIYQYFNSQEERKKMRAESQAPRNSRELAVRNQFFTPRYVVEFLTDNTLGRIWYEMTQGNTALVDSCRYLVRRPTEIFLKPGETAPEAETSDNEALSQEELLKQPVYIPHRPLKDPRSIRMLDPACGSMHFGLYAFDLFERIYIEAWQLEQQLGPDAFTREAGQQALQSAFDSLEAFKQQIPQLIIEHNIHGVDIDPRAVQIAGLSLWQRAQRAWHQQGIKPQQRPTIVKSNIVCAEPMPGEKALLQEFTSKLNPPVLGQLLEVIFDKMQLAGEAGTLLKIEEEIQTAIHEAREQWLKQSGSNSVGDMFQAELDAATPQAKLGFDLRGIDDATFWDDAEQRILQALSDYSDKAESNADQKRLFAEDAAKGFAFIDLCRKRFDVVLMNPPFGEATSALNKKLTGYLVRNLYGCFIQRGTNLLTCFGLIGAITDSTYLKQPTFLALRQMLLSESVGIGQVVDLGWGVLDANVQTALITAISREKGDYSSVDLSKTAEKEKRLLDITSSNSFDIRLKEEILNLPKVLFAPNLPVEAIPKIISLPMLGEMAELPWGCGANDSTRLFRLRWELDGGSASTQWSFITNGGEYSPFYRENFLAARIRVENGDSAFSTKFKNETDYLYDSAGEHLYFLPGLTYPKRSRFLHVAALPKDHLFTPEGKGLFVNEGTNIFLIMGILNSSFSAQYADFLCGPHKQKGDVELVGVPTISAGAEGKIERIAIENNQIAKQNETYREDSTLFLRPFDFPENVKDPKVFKRAICLANERISAGSKSFFSNMKQLDSVIESECSWLEIDSQLRDELDRVRSGMRVSCKVDESSVISYLFGVVIGRWDSGSLEQKRDNLELGLPFDRVPQRPFAASLSCEGYRSLDILVSNKLLASGREKSEVVGLIFELLRKILPENVGDAANELEAALGVRLSEYFSNPNKFFDYHLKLYSSGRRQAPVYWPLQTPSGSYTLWVYYHRLNEQTLYTCVNDFVEPKLQQVEQDLNGLRSKSARSSQEEKELEKLSDLAIELRDFRDELLRLARFWKPNLNDGVQITAAPLWKLFQHKAWQKKLKETWESLEKGDYDWAHLACSIWPERVLRKCHQDRSLAIAHDVEDHFWQEVEVPVKRGKKLTGETKLEWQPKDLSEVELKTLIGELVKERQL